MKYDWKKTDMASLGQIAPTGELREMAKNYLVPFDACMLEIMP